MRILGIDPGIARTGWGVVEVVNSNIKAQDYGCFETSSKKQTSERLVEIHNFIRKTIKEQKPDELAIEDLFFNNNAKTAFIVGQARGVVLLTSAISSIPSFVYTPLQVKIAVSGYGRADKPQVGQMVKTILCLKTMPRPDDTTDALAIALTHAFSRKSLK
ncbi:crossover junction endodeoxyribonuclease RuvC [Patescibacteria group bacterium]|nr:crossover junction endodeoxyribonuclease RuvC [Patescibacteria group bacterium]